jgi:hypothetical protein
MVGDDLPVQFSSVLPFNHDDRILRWSLRRRFRVRNADAGLRHLPSPPRDARSIHSNSAAVGAGVGARAAWGADDMYASAPRRMWCGYLSGCEWMMNCMGESRFSAPKGMSSAKTMVVLASNTAAIPIPRRRLMMLYPVSSSTVARSISDWPEIRIQYVTAALHEHLEM